MGSNLIGFVGGVSAEELTALGERGYEENDYVGKQGIESWGEEILAGKKGGRLTILTQEGQEVETLADTPAVQSRSLYLTIDTNLQRAAEEALQNRKGSIIIADVATGHILAMACYPRFDPNIMSSDLDPAARAALAANPDQPLVNRATQGAGSAMPDLQPCLRRPSCRSPILRPDRDAGSHRRSDVGHRQGQPQFSGCSLRCSQSAALSARFG